MKTTAKKLLGTTFSFLMLLMVAGSVFKVSADVLASPYLIVDEEFFIEPGGDIPDPTPVVDGASYNPDTYTLTLDGYDGKTICSHGFNLKIVVKGENTITASAIEFEDEDVVINPGGAINVGLNADDDDKPYSVAISGSGTLNVIGGEGYGISGKTSISGTTVDISINEAESFGIDTHGAALDITDNAKVTVKATGNSSQAILASQVKLYNGAILKEGDTAATAKVVSKLNTIGGEGKQFISIMPPEEKETEKKEESIWNGPKTGDNTIWIVVGISVVLLIAVGLIVLGNRKKSKQI